MLMFVIKYYMINNLKFLINFFPCKSHKKIKQNKEWFDKELKNLLLKKEKLFKAFLKQKKTKRLLPK